MPPENSQRPPALPQVGSLILELLRHAGPHLVPLLPGLLAALARKLAAADDSATVQSLLTVVAQLVRLDAPRLVGCLAGVALEDGRSALAVVMDKWCERQIEIRTGASGCRRLLNRFERICFSAPTMPIPLSRPLTPSATAYDIKLTTTALGTLLTCGHPALDGIVVRGRRLDTGGSIRTRARARAQAEQWTQVPLRVKLLMLLTDAYIEATTQGGRREGGACGAGILLHGWTKC